MIVSGPFFPFNAITVLMPTVMRSMTSARPFFFNDTAPTEIYTRPYTLSLHDALPISGDPPNRILIVRTADGGVHWSPPVKTVLPNPNAAIGSVLLSGGPLLLVFNNAEEDRENLSLARSTDFGNTWRIAHRFEGDSGSARAPVPEYSYPWIMPDRAGDVHLLYTWGRSRIKHVRFNPAWVEGRP